jgi:hypothetical protein
MICHVSSFPARMAPTGPMRPDLVVLSRIGLLRCQTTLLPGTPQPDGETERPSPDWAQWRILVGQIVGPPGYHPQ